MNYLKRIVNKKSSSYWSDNSLCGEGLLSNFKQVMPAVPANTDQFILPLVGVFTIAVRLSI
jgi:hypothetical protein